MRRDLLLFRQVSWIFSSINSGCCNVSCDFNVQRVNDHFRMSRIRFKFQFAWRGLSELVEDTNIALPGKVFLVSGLLQLGSKPGLKLRLELLAINIASICYIIISEDGGIYFSLGVKHRAGCAVPLLEPRPNGCSDVVFCHLWVAQLLT